MIWWYFERCICHSFGIWECIGLPFSICSFFFVWNMGTLILPVRLHFEAFLSRRFNYLWHVKTCVLKMNSLNLGAGWSVFEVHAKNHSDRWKTIFFWQEVVRYWSRKVHAGRHAIISESKQLCQICVGDSLINNGFSIPCTSISFLHPKAVWNAQMKIRFQDIDVIVTQPWDVSKSCI